MATQNQAHAEALEQIVDALHNIPEDTISKWEVCGRLWKLIKSLKDENAKHVPQKRESDTSNWTRREGTSNPLDHRKGSRGRRRTRRASESPQHSSGSGRDSPNGKAEVPPKTSSLERDQEPKKGGSNDEEWTTVARRADKAKPGNVKLNKTQGQRPKGEGPPRQRTPTPTSTSAKTRREAGVIRMDITREVD